MKEVILGFMCTLCCIIAIVSLRTLDKINERLDRKSVEYQFVVTDTMMTVFDGSNVVGTVKIQGQLDSLLVDYNE